MKKTVSHCLAFSRLLLPVIGEITPRRKNENRYLSILMKQKATSRGTLSRIFSCHVELKEKKIEKLSPFFHHSGRNGERINLTNGRPLSLTFPVKDIKNVFISSGLGKGRGETQPPFYKGLTCITWHITRKWGNWSVQIRFIFTERGLSSVWSGSNFVTYFFRSNLIRLACSRGIWKIR